METSTREITPVTATGTKTVPRLLIQWFELNFNSGDVIAESPIVFPFVRTR